MRDSFLHQKSDAPKKQLKMYDWHKAYETKDIDDLADLFLQSKQRKDLGKKMLRLLLDKPNSRRGYVVELMEKEGYAKATIERTLSDLEKAGMVSSEGKFLKTGRYYVNLNRLSSSLNRLSRSVKKISQDLKLEIVDEKEDGLKEFVEKDLIK